MLIACLVACPGRPSAPGAASDMLYADARSLPHPDKLWSNDVKNAATRLPDVDRMRAIGDSSSVLNSGA